MVKREKTTDVTGTIDLVKTYSTLGLKLKQEETEQIYGKEVVDAIAGYDENNIPYSRFTYTETNIPDDPDEPIDTEIAQKAEAFDYLTGRSGESE